MVEVIGEGSGVDGDEANTPIDNRWRSLGELVAERGRRVGKARFSEVRGRWGEGKVVGGSDAVIAIGGDKLSAKLEGRELEDVVYDTGDDKPSKSGGGLLEDRVGIGGGTGPGLRNDSSRCTEEE